MIEITKNNFPEFLKHYHFLHDSRITKINYEVEKSEIELIINVFWSGEPIIKEDNSYETNNTKLKIVFKEIHKIGINEDIS